MAQDDLLDQLVSLVRSGSKYRHISAVLIRNVGSRELEKRRNLKEAVKATRNKLHQVGAAYQESAIPYALWTKELQNLPADLDDPRVREFILRCLPAHASTRERIPILSRFYAEALAPIQPVESIIDLACGLNPLTIPWMGLAHECRYTAVDIYEDLKDYLSIFFGKFHIRGESVNFDLTRGVPPVEAQLTLILKTIPCLEQADKDAGARILSSVTSPNILVSFPARSLGGKSKGMVQNYENHFQELISAFPWKVTRFDFPGELVFLVQK